MTRPFFLDGLKTEVSKMLDTPETNANLKHEWRRVVRPLIDELEDAGEFEFLYNYSMQILERCGRAQRQRAVHYAQLLLDSNLPQKEAIAEDLAREE